ncbi:MAG TPA: efflux RND transporter permease subunit [Bdellovibrionota bacterium]|nr:efflux RND transporter permease subunit [Bdellovibrionota bacterium]
MSRISEVSIKNPVFAWMLMIGLMFFGWIGFSRLGVSQMPDVDFPVISVTVMLEGAAPEIMETEVVDVVEDSIMSIQGVREVKSSARQGTATVTIEFELNREIDVALQEVQTKVTQAQRRLPAEIDPPLISKVNPEDQPIMWVGFYGKDKSLRQLIDYAEDHVKPFLQTISGVGDVFLGGFSDRNLRVWVDADELTKREITIDDVISSIQTEHEESPAGRIETSETEFNIRVMGEAATPEAFGDLVIAQRGGQPVYRPYKLKEVATIEDGTNDIRRIARVNGEPALGLGIRKQRGSNAVDVAERVRERLGVINKSLPEGFKIGINFDSTRFIKDSVSELNFTLVLSAILTSLVCWLFLGSWSSTLNILLAIPTSVLGTFLVLYFLGFTLNTFTLLGLTLAIGIVVDDAIMVLENITRNREGGKSRLRAALDGSREIAFAAMAATAAVIAIFLPVAFMSGVIGYFFYQFGMTISVAVALSLLEALTLTPMRCSQFLEAGSQSNWLGRTSDRAFNSLKRGYQISLSGALRWKYAVVIGSFILFGLSLLLTKTLRSEFVPSQDQSMFMVRMQAPIGSSLDYTDAKFKKAEEYLASRKDVARYFAAIGGFGGGEVDTGILFVTLAPRNERVLTQNQIIDETREKFNAIGGVRPIVQDLSTRGFTADRGFPIEFSIQGPDWDKLGEHSKQITNEMEKAGLFEDIDTDYRVGVPEIRIYPERGKAADRGVSMASIARTINATLGGIRAGKYTHGGRRYDVRLSLTKEDRESIESIKGLLVRNNRGEVIPLSEVVRVVQKPSLQSVTRRDRQRSIGIFSNVKKDVSQTKAIDVSQEIAGRILPQGYNVLFTGGSKTFQESFKGLFWALILGIIVSYMVLGSQFNSFLHPITILIALPFSVTGGLLALLIANQSLNIFSFIGLLLLMGIVKKNSILLVDFTNQVRDRGKAARPALLEACPIRLRPILMTTVSTIAAALPPALALGPGSETRIPMAITVIGGVTVSTALSLFVVPCLYEILSPLERQRPAVLIREEAAAASAKGA